jgi:proteasome lid subunit RPN8/RPN11
MKTPFRQLSKERTNRRSRPYEVYRSARVPLIHSREAFQGAVRDRATEVVIVHNHPSGNVEPSAEDAVVDPASP